MKELLENLSEMELVECYSEIINKLKEKEVIRTKNIVGTMCKSVINEVGKILDFIFKIEVNK